MKHLTPYILAAILGLTLSFSAQAQSPEKFNYQAVLRNNGQLVVNGAADVRFTIHDLTANGAIVYQETHNSTTDQYGLINLAVGSGTVVAGTFSTINWGTGDKYLQVEVDYGPGGYDDLGARQLLSVPYALYSGGGSGSGWSLTGNAGTDSTNFIGTTDNEPLRFRFNNNPAGLISLANTAFGRYAFSSNTTGTNNTAMGDNALYSNTTGFYNTGIGSSALEDNTTGKRNTAVGRRALKSNTTGYNSSAIGFFALQDNTTGIKNVAVGAYALRFNTTGHFNTAIGNAALLNNKSGNYNTALGYNADVADTNLYNTTAIGYNANALTSNTVVIGNGNITQIGGYANWSNLSDARFKTNMQPIKHGLDFIMKLKPITYHYNMQKLHNFMEKGEAEEKDPEWLDEAMAAKAAIQYSGFSAQQVEKAAKSIGYDFSGVHVPTNELDHYTLAYAEFVVPLVKAVQEQQKMIETQQKTIAQQKQENATLKARVATLETKLQSLAKRMAALETK